VGEDECVVRGQGGEIVRCRDEWLARQRRDSDRHTLTKFWVRIESRAHGRAARRQLTESGQNEVEPRKVRVELGDVAENSWPSVRVPRPSNGFVRSS